jgi:hypothetical protein
VYAAVVVGFLYARVGGSTEWDGPANTSRGVYYTTTCVVCMWAVHHSIWMARRKRKKKKDLVFFKNRIGPEAFF